ncbi:PhzF family phenazine biosynthesis protein [Halovulum sp. GXIMD14793]
MVIGTPQLVSTGSCFCVTVLSSRDVVEQAVLDTQRLAEWRTRHQTEMEPFLVALEGATENGQTFARLLLAPPNRPEDPFTGSATGCMAAYLWAKDLIETPCFVAEQGHGMGRPGQAQVEVLGPRDAITGIQVGGQGVVVLEGRLLIP